MRVVTLLAVLSLASLGPSAFAQTLQADRLGTYASGLFDEGAAEIAAYDPATKRLFVVNAAANEVVALDVSDPETPTEAFTIDLSTYGAGANSVAVSTVPFNGTTVAVAVEADPKTDPGAVVLFNADGSFREQVTVGALPDAVAFSPDGFTIVVANEGEPNADYSVDPEGTISIVRLQIPAADGPLEVASTTTLDFQAFNDGSPRYGEITADPSIRIFGPSATVAQDIEPEFAVVSPDGATAYITLQENNALAVIDLSAGTPTITAVLGLGYKDHALAQNALDASDRDDAVAITTWRVYGMYQPDGIAAASVGGQTYLFTANEGDAREYDTFAEEERVKDLTLNPGAFPNAAALQADAAIGRLTVTTTEGDVDGDGTYEALYAYGARSLSIHAADGSRVWDSGDGIERQIAALIEAGTLPEAAFNATNDENDTFDNRSDNKGPEPEGVVVGEVDGTPYAFVGLERVSAVIVYDVSDPEAPTYAGFLVNRDFSVDAQLGDGSTNPAVGDLGPEGLVFVSAADSPTGRALLVTSNEISGTVTLWGLGPAGTSNGAAPEAASDLLRLRGAVPNPTRDPEVAFDLDAPAEVRLVVFDALGREVARREGTFGPGADLRLGAEAAGLASGVYLYEVTATAGADVLRRSGQFVLAR